MAGRAALVTGGGGGIGEATGRLVAVEAAAASIARDVKGARVIALVADLTREAECDRVVGETLAELHGLHTLVNVAGVRLYTALAEADSKGWEFILGVNVLATAYSSKAALPALRKSGRGTIVNLSSVYGVKGRTGMGQYDTTKAAVLGFTRALAMEEAPHGIRVNAVCPGGTITPYHIRRAAAQGVSEAEMRTQRTRDNLLGRWAEPREVAYPILFLASDESSYITGATLMVDAGKSIM